MLIGSITLRDLTAQDVRRTLSKLAQMRSTRTMASTHNVLVRAIRHAEANDHVGRNVATLVKPPQGKTGRPSRAMTAAEAAALLIAAKDHPRLGAFDVALGTIRADSEAAAARKDGDHSRAARHETLAASYRTLRDHSAAVQTGDYPLGQDSPARRRE